MEDSSRSIQPARVLRAFRMSAELALLDAEDRELVWVQELLDTMDCAGWTWDELDLTALTTALFDAIHVPIEHPPQEPDRVASMLGAFMRFAGREYGAPHATECCAYLRSPRAVREIRKWVVPIDTLAD